jgi:dienelactone hydrolase
MMEKLDAPSSWFTTIFYKPFYILRAASLAIPFLIRNRISVAKPRVFNFVQALRTSPPPFPTNSLKIAAAGFCWGGKYTVLLAQDTPSSRVVPYSPPGTNALPLSPLIDCAFMAHPSMLKVPEDINEISVPISIAVGENDQALGKDVFVVKEILEVKKKGDHEVNILEGAKHGFGVRTVDDKFQWECSAKAETQAVEWFKRWFV